MFDKEKIIQLLEDGKSLSEILKYFGKKTNGGNYRSLKKFACENSINLNVWIDTKDEYEKNPKHCASCGKEIDYEHRHNIYCSKSCAAHINNSKFHKKIKINKKERKYPDKRKYEKNELYCIVCGKKLEGNQKKYCCEYCKRKNYSYSKYQTNYSRNKDKEGAKLKYKYILKKGGKCSVCGYDKNLSSLTFHHIKDKEFELTSRAFRCLPIEILENEMEKCILLCQNCHNELHHPDLDKNKINDLLDL